MKTDLVALLALMKERGFTVAPAPFGLPEIPDTLPALAKEWGVDMSVVDAHIQEKAKWAGVMEKMGENMGRAMEEALWKGLK